MESRTTEDIHLVQAVLQGRHEEYRELVQRYQKLVAGVAWRMGIPQAEIEDVVSEVFIKVFQNLHRYQPDRPFGAWLHRLAANHAIDHRRRERPDQRGAELPKQLTDPAAGPEAGIERRERAGLVRAALLELAPRYREALCLVHVEGMTVEEASRLLGIPEGTLKTRLMRGRELLKSLLTRRHGGVFGD